jgi:adenylate cyclase class IV
VLDNVKELGFFIEIETIKDFDSVERAREKLFEFAQTLGIDTSNPDERGYAFLLMKKSGIIK